MLGTFGMRGEEDGVAQARIDETALFPAGDGPERIEDGLWRIPLPLPFALRSANVYLVGDGAGDGRGGWTLVDAGLGLPADEAALRAGLARAGVALEEITALILTHAHPDHVGLAGLVAGASGAPTYMLAGEDERMYRVWGDAEGDEVAARVEAMCRANGMRAEDLEGYVAGSRRMRRVLRLPPRDRVRTLADGETLRLGAHEYRVLWTPGHSDYHMCLLRDDGLFVAGDHVLPGITPNIGLYPDARPEPLRDYFGALARARDLDVRLVLPGHRRPFADLAGRADELRAHHEERGERVLSLLSARADGADASALAAALFGARLAGADDRRFALAETLAHLEHLRAGGRVAREDRDGHVVYRVGRDTSPSGPPSGSPNSF